MTLIQRLTLALAEIASAIRLRGQPRGGTFGQVLVKNSALDFDSSWQTLPGYEQISNEYIQPIEAIPASETNFPFVSGSGGVAVIASNSNTQVTLVNLSVPQENVGETLLVRVYASASEAQDGWNLPAGQDANCLGWLQVEAHPITPLGLQFGLNESNDNAIFVTVQTSGEAQWGGYITINTLKSSVSVETDPGDLAGLFTSTYIGADSEPEPEFN